jgi:O-antigen/teichoic acid export membrane protein
MAVQDNSTEDLAGAELVASAHDLRMLARGTGLGLVGGVLREGLAALAMLLLAHLIAGSEFGLVQLAISLVVILATLGKGGFNLVVARLVAIYEAMGERDRVKGALYGSLLWTAVFSIALTILVVVLAPWISSLFHKPAFAPALVAYSWWIPTASLTMVLVSAVLALGSARPRVVVRDLVVPGLFLLLAAGFVVLWRTATAAGWAYSLSSLVGLVLAWYYLRKFFPYLGSTRAVYEHRLLLRTSLPLLLTDLAATGLAQVDVVVVGRLLPATQVGIYGAASRLSLLGIMALNALNQILAPVISRLHHQQKRAELDVLLKTFTRLCLTVSVPLIALLVGMSGPVMGVLGARFVAGALALVIASVGVLFNVGTGSVGMALMMTGYQWLAFLTNMISIALLVGMVWWLTPGYGVTGAALGLAVATSLANLLRLWLVHRVLRVNPLSVPMIRPLVAGLACAGVAWGLTRALGLTGREGLAYLLPVLGALSILSLMVYGALVMLLGMEPTDRRAAQAILDRIRGRTADNASAPQDLEGV